MRRLGHAVKERMPEGPIHLRRKDRTSRAMGGSMGLIIVFSIYEPCIAFQYVYSPFTCIGPVPFCFHRCKTSHSMQLANNNKCVDWQRGNACWSRGRGEGLWRPGGPPLSFKQGVPRLIFNFILWEEKNKHLTNNWINRYTNDNCKRYR